MGSRLDGISFGKIVQIREGLLKSQAAGKKVFRFESGDPSFNISQQVLEGITRAGQEGKTHYIPNDGIPELKKELKIKLEQRNGIHLSSTDSIFITNGAMHALYVLWHCLLEPGDEVIVPDPMWTEAVENIRLASAKPVAVILDHDDGYIFRPEAIEEKINGKTKAIFVNSPHNPTGSVLSRETLLGILRLAEKHGLHIVTDEAYEDIVYDAKHHSLAAIAEQEGFDESFQERIVSIFSFSKSSAMSGLRVGYIVAREAHIRERISKLLRCTINGVNSIAQWAAIEALRTDRSHLNNMLDEYRIRRDTMISALSGIPGLQLFKPEGAFYIWCKIDPSLYRRLEVKNADALSRQLAEAGIGSAPGDSFGLHCDDAIRFAYSCGTAMVKEGAEQLSAALRK